MFDLSAVFSDFTLWKTQIVGCCHKFLKLMVPQMVFVLFLVSMFGMQGASFLDEKVCIALLSCACILVL